MLIGIVIDANKLWMTVAQLLQLDINGYAWLLMVIHGYQWLWMMMQTCYG